MEERSFEIALTNLVENPTLQPESVKPLFKRLADMRPMADNIERSISQARQSMTGLQENRARLAGSMQVVLELIEEALPKELVEKYGKEYIKKEGTA